MVKLVAGMSQLCIFDYTFSSCSVLTRLVPEQLSHSWSPAPAAAAA